MPKGAALERLSHSTLSTSHANATPILPTNYWANHAMPVVLRVTLCVVLAWGWLVASPASAHRVALIIGNSQYEHVTKLGNAVRDARLIGDAATAAGFTDVRVVPNATSTQIAHELEAFYYRAKDADIAFIYFAGHGFVMPERTIATLEDGFTGLITGTDWKGDLTGGITIANLLLAGQRASKIVVVVDACRSYFREAPGEYQLRSVNLPTAIPWSMHGREPMKLSNLFFVASTWNGAPAFDGAKGGNSVFAKTFVTLISARDSDQPGFGARLTKAVTDATFGDQVPFVITNPPNAGNPLLSGGSPALLPRPSLESSITIKGASDAVFDSSGRVLVLRGGSVTDGAGRRVHRSDQGSAIALSPSGSKLLLWRGDRIEVKTIRTGRISSGVSLKGAGVLAAAVTDEGSYAAATDDGRVLGHNQLFPGYWPAVGEYPLSFVSIPGNDAFIYYVMSNGDLCLYGINLQRVSWCSHVARFRSAVESPGGNTILTLDSAGRVEIRTMVDAVRVAELRPRQYHQSTYAAYAADGRMIVVGAADGVVTIWDAEAAKVLVEIPDGTEPVLSAHFSVDGSRIVVTRVDGTIQVWRIKGR